MSLVELLVLLKGVGGVTQRIRDAVSAVRQAEEILFGGTLSPGEKKRVIEQLTASAEELAKAHQQIADTLASERLAEAVDRMAGGIENIGLFFGVATVWLREGIALLSRILDLAESRGADVHEIRKIRNLLPPPPDLP